MKRFTAGAVAVVVFFACIVTAAVTGGFDKNLTVISIDVNPSIELTVDVDGKIDKVIGINAEAQTLIDSLELKGLEVDAAMDLIIGALVENNYISEIANSILISISNDKTEIAEEYEKLVIDAINQILEPLDTDINIISQIIGEQPDNIIKLAEDLGISEGKAKFISDFVAENNHLSIKDLAGMSINDISILINSNAIITPDGLEITGQANASAYISKPAALSAVLKKLDIPVEEIIAADVSFNYKDGAMIFDVTFIYGETEYNVTVNAETANILQVLKQAVDPEELLKEGIDITVSDGVDESVKEIFGVTSDELIKEAVDSMINEDGTINENGVDDFINKKVDEAIDSNIPSTGNADLDASIKDTANSVINDTIEDIKQNGVTDDTVDNAIDKAVDETIDNYLKDNGITTGDPDTDEAIKNAASDTIKEAIENGTLDELLGMLGK